MDYEIGKRYPIAPDTGGRRMRDVIPNNPEEFRSKIFSSHLRNKRDGLPRKEGDPSANAASTNSMYIGLARQHVSCPECGAEPGQNCTSTAAKRRGIPLDRNVHNKRFMMAKRVFARKS